MSIQINQTPVGWQPLLSSLDKNKDGFISGTEFVPVANLLAKELGGTDKFEAKDENRAEQYLLNQLGVREVQLLKESKATDFLLEKEKAIEAIKLSPTVGDASQRSKLIIKLSKELQNDKEIILAAVSKFGCLLKNVPEWARDDKV